MVCARRPATLGTAIFGPHGGLLDRLDAVLFTIVVGYYLSVAFV